MKAYYEAFYQRPQHPEKTEAFIDRMLFRKPARTV